mmetsp:Transcript_65625/g.148099  ORF Transcript_65625/g.148099 Transcript_65625/m.148099 type:complete len:273 (+) Transcript_65625:238-1056(+)
MRLRVLRANDATKHLCTLQWRNMSQAATTQRVDELDSMPSSDVFQSKYFDARPVVVRGGVSHWPALERWTDLGYLRKFDTVVPVEVGGSYLDPSTQRSELPLSLYLDYVGQLGCDEAPLEPGKSAYMAQAPLMPGVLESGDVEVPAWCSAYPTGAGRGDQYARMAWLGPKGTVTPCHRDPYHNAFAQVTGAKHFLLFAPSDERLLYPSQDPLQPNSSRVDVEAPDLEAFPHFSEATPFEATLEAGDLLYIPRRWWHHVRSLSRSTSVTFWWL